MRYLKKIRQKKKKTADNDKSYIKIIPSLLHILTPFFPDKFKIQIIQRYLLNLQQKCLFFPLILKVRSSDLILEKNNTPGPFESIWQRFVDFGDIFLDIYVRPTYDYCSIWSSEEWISSGVVVSLVYLVVIALCTRFTPKMLNRYNLLVFLLPEFVFHYLLATYYHYHWATFAFSYQGDFLLSKPLVLAPMLFLIQVIVYYCFCYKRPVANDEKKPYRNKAYKNHRSKNKIFKNKMIIKNTTKKKLKIQKMTRKEWLSSWKNWWNDWKEWLVHCRQDWLNILKTNRTKSTLPKFFFLYSADPSRNWTTLLNEFYNLWPLHQWISSLAGLIALYWVTGYYYNKWLSDKGGWLDWKMRIWLIISDLTINLMLGIYYMNHRETAMGVVMLKCPIAISPLIFILELVCFYIYYRFGKNRRTKKNTGSKTRKI